MRIAYTFPPNYAEICRRIPAVKLRPTIIFTYGDTLYNPGRGLIPDHLMAHEETHAREQAEMGIDEWWDQYLASPQFRLEQELKAYRVQYRVAAALPRHMRKTLLLKISADLGGPMYGKIVDKEQARKLITGGAQL